MEIEPLKYPMLFVTPVNDLFSSPMMSECAIPSSSLMFSTVPRIQLYSTGSCIVCPL